jgi:RNA polymerase sigma factor (sigma-70 family)
VGARERQEEGPEHVALGREVGQVVETIVGRLPLKQRLAFVQRKVHGLDYEAIGESLQCSAESARAHVFQALKKIRRALDGTEKEPRA